MNERFVPLSENLLHREDLSANALKLYALLVSNQTSADGSVFYGHAVGYEWIRSRWIGAPPLRSVQRYMKALKDAKLVEIRREFRGGMRIWLLESVKFAAKIDPPAEQLSLLSPVATMKRAVENPVQNVSKISDSPVFNNDKFGGIARHGWRQKEVVK
jgi:hypothetical protein